VLTSPHRRPPLFPYTTLFRSNGAASTQKETGDYQPIAAFISSKGNGLSPSFFSSFWVSHGLGIGLGRFDFFNFGCFSTTAAVNWVASKIPTRTSMAG